MSGKLHHLGSGSYVVHGVDKGQVHVMQKALDNEGLRRSKPSLAPLADAERTTISERSHPQLFGLFGLGRAQFTLQTEQADDIDLAEADAAHLPLDALTVKYPFLLRGGLVGERSARPGRPPLPPSPHDAAPQASKR